MTTKQTQNMFRKKRINSVIMFLVIGAIFLFFTELLSFDIFRALLGAPQGFIWMNNNFMPNEAVIYSTFIQKILDALWRTGMLAISATTISASLAFIAGVLGSQKTGVHPAVTYLVRIIAMVFRNIPLIAWSLILIFSFRQNEFTGFLALFFGTFGFLTRSFTEIIDEMDEGIIDALRASGATYFHIVFQAVLPMVSSQVISWLLFMIETNIRDATLVGILTGTGVGFLFNFYFTTFRYQRAGFVLLFVILSVVALEMISNKIRRMII